MKKPKTKKVTAWMMRDRGRRGMYHVYQGPRSNLKIFEGEWGVVRWLKAARWYRLYSRARDIRRVFHYTGPLPKPGCCIRVTEEVEKPAVPAYREAQKILGRSNA